MQRKTCSVRGLRYLQPSSLPFPLTIFTYVGHLENEIIKKGKGTDHPPISQLIFVVKELTHPELLHEEIPTLLNLLSQIESIRISAESQAQQALDESNNTRRHAGQRKPGSKPPFLKKKTKANLEGLLQGKAVVRLSYISEIVLPLYQLVRSVLSKSYNRSCSASLYIDLNLVARLSIPFPVHTLPLGVPALYQTVKSDAPALPISLHEARRRGRRYEPLRG